MGEAFYAVGFVFLNMAVQSTVFFSPPVNTTLCVCVTFICLVLQYFVKSDLLLCCKAVSSELIPYFNIKCNDKLL